MTKNCAAFPSERHTKAPDFLTEEHRETNLIGVVVGIDEKRAPPWGQRPAVDAKTVVLCCDEGLAGHHVQHWLVLASGKQREGKKWQFSNRNNQKLQVSDCLSGRLCRKNVMKSVILLLISTSAGLKRYSKTLPWCGSDF